MAEWQVRLERRDGASDHMIVGELDAAASDPSGVRCSRPWDRWTATSSSTCPLSSSSNSCVEVLLSAQRDLCERGVVLSVGAVSDDVRMVLEFADVDRRLGFH